MGRRVEMYLDQKDPRRAARGGGRPSCHRRRTPRAQVAQSVRQAQAASSSHPSARRSSQDLTDRRSPLIAVRIARLPTTRLSPPGPTRRAGHIRHSVLHANLQSAPHSCPAHGAPPAPNHESRTAAARSYCCGARARPGSLGLSRARCHPLQAAPISSNGWKLLRPPLPNLRQEHRRGAGIHHPGLPRPGPDQLPHLTRARQVLGAVQEAVRPRPRRRPLGPRLFLPGGRLPQRAGAHALPRPTSQPGNREAAGRRARRRGDGVP